VNYTERQFSQNNDGRTYFTDDQAREEAAKRGITLGGISSKEFLDFKSESTIKQINQGK
jgi:hypothetical protein